MGQWWKDYFCAVFFLANLWQNNFFVFSHIFSLQPFGASAKYFFLPGSIVQIYFLQFLPLSPRDQMGSPLYCHIFPNVITWIAPYVVNISPHVVKWAALILSYI